MQASQEGGELGRGGAEKAREPGRFWVVPLTIAVLLLLASAATAGAVSWNLHRSQRGASLAPRDGSLPVLGTVPPFSMVNQRGERVDARSLLGRPWVVDFIFLSCTTSCPKLTERMAALQARLSEKKVDVGLVSMTVDPENDTPALLSAYAGKWNADPARWSFLSGKSADLDAVIVDGFKIHVGKVADGAGIGTIMHGDWFVLVDGRGRVRGYYAVSDAQRFEQLFSDAERLTREP